MTHGWTPERRAKQAQRIREWKPWEQSTGPITEAGKAIAARNADQGLGTSEMRALQSIVNQELRSGRRVIALAHQLQHTEERPGAVAKGLNVRGNPEIEGRPAHLLSRRPDNVALLHILVKALISN
jgi:hypothetical protein